MKIKFLIAVFGMASALSAADYLIIADPKLTPYTGAEDLITTHYGLQLLENKFTRPAHPPSRNWFACTKRLLDLAVVWEPINDVFVVLQHEIFGHGYRIRDIGNRYVKDEHYHINPPFPYGPGGGATIYRVSSALTTVQNTTIASAGVEATSILANRLKWKWLQNDVIDPKQATLYLWSQQDLTFYVLGMNKDDPIESGHDISSYLFSLNLTYPTDFLTKEQLKYRSLINFLDPFTYYSIFSWFYYIPTGKQGPIPMFGSKTLKYIPGGRLGLTPFGPEYYLENYFIYRDQPIYGYLKWGRHAGNSYWGIGAEYDALWRWKRASLGFRADLWEQPRLLAEDPMLSLFHLEDRFFNEENFLSTEKKLHQNTFGGALSLIGMYKWGYLQLGFKTKGFLPGQSLKAGPIFYAGFRI